MAINKVVYGNRTLVDLTGDTATANDVLNAKKFHTKAGVQTTGTLVNILYGTSATPSQSASNYPAGTLYIQYE